MQTAVRWAGIQARPSEPGGPGRRAAVIEHPLLPGTPAAWRTTRPVQEAPEPQRALGRTERNERLPEADARLSPKRIYS